MQTSYRTFDSDMPDDTTEPGTRPSFAGLLRVCLLCLLALFAAGCSGTQAARRGLSRIVTPLPPPFLTGPAAVLLTNTSGFSARAEIQAQSSTGNQSSSSGELLGRGGKLLYAPRGEEISSAQQPRGGYIFIWDVAEGRGYVLSDALQGYAPVASRLQLTNIETSPSNVGAQRIANHPCESVKIVARAAEGPSAAFDVFRAMDLNGFPVRIESSTNATQFVLNLSKIRLEAPSAEVFSPPEGFTKYATPEAMADELAARQHNLRKKSSPQLQELMDLQQRRY